MKICATVAEYNPLHLGHIKHIEYVKNTLKADKLIVVMSGNFTQRGEPAILDKFTRAKHAIIAGADMVVELPSVFATGNAETFAKGAIKILKSMGFADEICFGVESGTKEDYMSLASIMNNETKEFKKTLKVNLDKGYSFVKARFETVKELYSKDFNEALISSPNNILGLEYTKAILKENLDLEIAPMIRTGNHNDTILKKGVTSATSIRETIRLGKIKKIKKNVPPYVYKDLKGYPFDFEKIVMAKLLTTSAQNLALVPDCTEGLENRIKALCKDNLQLDVLIDKVTTKRYTEARIRRILIANLLGITQEVLDDCYKDDLFVKVLAVNSDSKDLISLLSKNCSVPVLTRKSDVLALKKTAQTCFDIDVLANDLYNVVTNKKENEHNMIII